MSTIIPSLPLDPSFYNLKEDGIAFFKAQTGIQDDDKLRDHILQVQADAYAVYPWPCIRCFGFTGLKISKYPAYEAILKLGKERPGALLLDVGCCFANDARKAIADGFPRENVIASDLYADFWDLGNKLYKTTRDKSPGCFLPGDIFDPAFLSPDASPAPSSSVPDIGPIPSLSNLTSLTPLQHHISIIHAGAFFHLFSKSQQRDLAHLLGTLLSPLPGSMIVGEHIGLPDTKENEVAGGGWFQTGDVLMFGHCPASWEDLWVGSDGVFKSKDVTVWVTAKDFETKAASQTVGDAGIKCHRLFWSVTRV